MGLATRFMVTREKETFLTKPELGIALDPQVVGRALQHRPVHGQVSHPLLTVLPSQAPDAATVHPTQTQNQCYLSNAAQITSKQNIMYDELATEGGT